MTPRAKAGPAERPHAGDADEPEHTGRDRVANGQEGEQWIDRNRVLDLDEGDAPDRGDDDERDQRHERKRRARANDLDHKETGTEVASAQLRCGLAAAK